MRRIAFAFAMKNTRSQVMARFQNLLVQQYTTVDHGRVHGFIHKDLGDLDRVASAILSAFPDLGKGG